jgi:putative oxidoreductase
MTSTWTDRGLLVLRLALGLVFVMHGWQKLTVLGIDGVAGFLTQLGIPAPNVAAVLLTTTELGGGLALIFGAFTRAASALIAFSMVVAVATVHLKNGFFLPNGYEFALTLLLANVAMTMTGAGRYSIDRILFGHHRHIEVRVTEIPASVPRRRAA